MAAINKHSHMPYYFQLAETLRRQIRRSTARGQAGPLPSEHELSEMHKISRATVRHALDLLERDGLIYKSKGKGTFVTRSRARYDLTSLVPTTEDILRRGLRPGTRVISVKPLLPTPTIAQALETEPGEEVYEIHRLRTADDEPISLQWSYIPLRLCPTLLDHDLSASLTLILEKNYDIVLWTAHAILRARLPQAVEEKLLKITRSSPVIVTEQQTYTREGQCVEFLKSVWRSDRYDFVVSLSRSTMSPP